MSTAPIISPDSLGEPTSGQLSQEGVPMIFKDGSKGMIPRSGVLAAVRSGEGQVAHYVEFPDGSKDYIPHENLQGAISDGGKVMDPSEVRQRASVTRAENPTVGDYAKIAGTTALMMLPAVGSSGKAATAAKMTEEAVEPSMRALWQIYKTTAQASEVSGAEVEAAGWGKFADLASKGAAEASQNGDTIKALAYHGASALAKASQGYEAAAAWVGKAIPFAPAGIRLLFTAKIAKDGYDWLFEDKKEAARQELYGDK